MKRKIDSALGRFIYGRRLATVELPPNPLPAAPTFHQGAAALGTLIEVDLEHSFEQPGRNDG